MNSLLHRDLPRRPGYRRTLAGEGILKLRYVLAGFTHPSKR
ncbi:MAG: hypothetical protein ABI409_06045 [Ramlibacter sp.]